MKAIMEFNLPDDKYDYELCNKASDMSLFIWELNGLIRDRLKYQTDIMKPNQKEVWEEIQEFIKENLVELPE